MLRIGSVQLTTPLLLAPVAGYHDLPYRLIVRSVPGYPCRPEELGGPLDTGDGTYGAVGLTCTELLCPQGLLRLSEQETGSWRAELSPREKPVCMQLYGADPALLAEAARWAESQGADLIDINMGCPVDKVTKKNGGSRLLCDLESTVHLAATVVRAVRIPVTAKIRLGWDEQSLITHSLPPRLCDAGIAAITVHGRTTAQMFSGQARLEGIRQVVEAVAAHHPQVPVIGNGDIQTPADARRMMDKTGCAGVMVARGAMGQPWLFREIAYFLATGDPTPTFPRAERARLVLRHFDLVREMRGDRHALLTIHKRMARYSPHLQPWPHVRRAVTEIRDAAQMRAFLLEGMERIAEEDGLSEPEKSACNF